MLDKFDNAESLRAELTRLQKLDEAATAVELAALIVETMRKEDALTESFFRDLHSQSAVIIRGSTNDP